MTLIVGVKCTDGIALAADTRISFGSAIQQDTAHKLDLIGSGLILGVAGSKSIAQEFLLELEKQVRMHDYLPYSNVDEAKQFFAAALSERFGSMVMRMKQSPFETNPSSQLYHESLIACTIPGCATTHLLYFDSFFVGTEINTTYPIQAIGSGTEAALFFGTVIRRIVYRGRIPSVREGLIGAYWILDMAIKCNTLGVGGQIDCACLYPDGNAPQGYILGTDELGEIHSFLNATEHRIAELFQSYPSFIAAQHERANAEKGQSTNGQRSGMPVDEKS